MLVPVVAPASHLVGQVNALYADRSCCGDAGVFAAADVVDPKERKLFEAFAKACHENPNRSELATLQSPEWKDLYRHVATSLIGGAEKGYQQGAGKKLSQLEEGSQDALLLGKLRTNLHWFSAHKNYHLLVDLNQQLTDAKGNLRAWSDFRKEALKLSSQYNVVWLRAEYNAAVAASQMAAKWQRFEQSDKGDTYLRYDTAGDQRVRPAHQVLDGTTLPMDDPFWDAHFPPLGWNCRCDATQVLRSRAEIKRPNKLPEIQPGFRTNVGKTGEAFTRDHPYFTNTPSDVERQLSAIVEEAVGESQPKGISAETVAFMEKQRDARLIEMRRQLMRTNGLTEEQAAAQIAGAQQRVTELLKNGVPQIRIGAQSPTQDQYTGAADSVRSILKTRFKTQFETQTSNATFSPFQRYGVEARLFDYPKNQKVKRPIYGALVEPKREPADAATYGVYRFRLKRSVLDHATVVGADTLNYPQALATPYHQASVASFVSGKKRMERLSQHLARITHAGGFEDIQEEYVELQFHQRVTSADIEALIVDDPAKVPADIQKLCAKKGIPIMKGD